MQVREVNPEVFYVTDHVVRVGGTDLDSLKESAERSARRRARVCTHRDTEDKLHEMMVVLMQDAYLRPEKHVTKVESYHIIEGAADVVVFDELGNIDEVVQLGDHSSGGRFYFRISTPFFYHTVMINSDFLLYHETATGPFRKADTIVAPWAPDESDVTGRVAYMADLSGRIHEFLSARDGDGE